MKDFQNYSLVILELQSDFKKFKLVYYFLLARDFFVSEIIVHSWFNEFF